MPSYSLLSILKRFLSMAEAANKNKPHKLIIDNRNSMSMTGVTKVISIDTDLVLLVTEQGKLKITGKNMQASTLDLDKGILELTGNFNTMVYSGEKEGALSLKSRSVNSCASRPKGMCSV